ncbi:MAG: ComF family protein [Lachnospiraceae bacterium]|nr:ComF family protein [Lachnospiraceae bacterium]
MMLKILHNRFCDLLYPRRCALCDAVLSHSEGRSGFCSFCRGKLKPITEPRCMKCGAALKEEEEEYCRRCKKHRHEFERGLALYEYADVCEAIYRMKYSGRKEYARPLGREMARRFAPQLREWGIQALVPIPLFPAKQRRRGYNQAEALADAMGEALGIPVERRLVRRSRNTRPMKLLGDKERQINLKNAFLCAQDGVKLQRVVLVDDIYTTGSTMDAVTGCLKAAGVKEVYFVTLAIGSGV